MRCFVSLGILGALLWASSLSAEQGRVIRTVDLNADCIADTLYGSADAVHDVPTYVIWGRRQQASTCDSLYYASLLPQLWQHRTEFRFDGFTVEHCAIRSVQINDDGYRDMLLVVHGYREEQLANSAIRRSVHHLLIAVPAQRGLDSLQTMVFRIDSGIVLSPFPHGYLRAGIEVGMVQRIPRSLSIVSAMTRIGLSQRLRWLRPIHGATSSEVRSS